MSDAFVLKAAEAAGKILEHALPLLSSGGQIRMRAVLLQLGELIADERQHEKFGRVEESETD